MCDFHSEIKPGMKICDSCRKQVANAKKEKIDKDTDLDVEEQNIDDDDAYTDKNCCNDFLNNSVSCIEESRVRKKRIMQESTVKEN